MIRLPMFKPNHARAELGYWIGVPFWGRGFATEAARALVNYGFLSLQLHKVSARHMEFNPGSGRVMQKLGMQQEGRLIDEVCKDGRFHTQIVYGLLAS